VQLSEDKITFTYATEVNYLWETNTMSLAIPQPSALECFTLLRRLARGDLTYAWVYYLLI
jgi:hypothetical protein